MVFALGSSVPPRVALAELPEQPDGPADETVCSEDCDRFGGTERCRCYSGSGETTEPGW